MFPDFWTKVLPTVCKEKEAREGSWGEGDAHRYPVEGAAAAESEAQARWGIGWCPGQRAPSSELQDSEETADKEWN